jgi:integrase
VGSIEPYKTAKGKRYRVRYRDPDRRSRERAGFARKVEAEEYLASVTVAAVRGEYVDPGAGRVTVTDLAIDWLATRTHLKPSSYRPLEIAWRVHVEPTWGRRRVADVQHSDIQRWVSALATGDERARSATTVIRAFGVLSSVLEVAVRDRRIPSNPARGVKLPRKARKERAYLTHRQVELLATEARDRGTLIRLLAYSGIRWGEAAGLRWKAVDLRAKRVTISENAVAVGGRIIVGTPKTHQARAVPLPAFLLDELSERLAGAGHDDLVFGTEGVHLRPPDRRKGWFVSAVRRAQKQDPTLPTITPHDLRHTAASLAVSAGANVKVVQRMLGHASAAMTLDVYADLFEDDLDSVTDKLDVRRREELES